MSSCFNFVPLEVPDSPYTEDAASVLHLSVQVAPCTEYK